MLGKVAIVTGAARGLGLVEAEMLSSRGASVLLCDVLETEGKAEATRLRNAGYRVRFATLDVTSPEGWQRVVAEATEWQGGVDILVNNAGILRRKTIAEASLEDWNAVLAVNLTGAFLGTQAVAPSMIRRGGGAIVNISSNSAFSGHADPAYTASKWGLRGLTRSTALEFASSGIRANSVCPGLVVTDLNRGAPHLTPMIDLTPAGRPVEAREVAALVCFLASDDAMMITGEDIVIDGGFVMGGAYRSVSLKAGHFR
jgi:NAD(P)-dependent dehydrogenase (short-subunit alcohol dehydrogenase family)